VLLPLLEAEVVERGWVSQGDFLAGYGAAQAVPGPLFTFAAYLGAVMQTPPSGLVGAILTLFAIFLPASLLIAGAMPFWNHLRSYPLARRMLLGVNAAVVGLLAAVFYDPVFAVGAGTPATLAIATAAFVALSAWKLPAWAVVVGAGILGGLLL
jgi:chromate transporter